jgi:hypothetical protein
VVGPHSRADKVKDIYIYIYIYIYSFLETLLASNPFLDDKNRKQKVSEDNFEKNGPNCRKPTPSWL